MNNHGGAGSGSQLPRVGYSNCQSCGNPGVVNLIHKQIHGEWRAMWVCNFCLLEHQRELEMTRQNFQRQFGGE